MALPFPGSWFFSLALKPPDRHKDQRNNMSDFQNTVDFSVDDAAFDAALGDDNTPDAPQVADDLSSSTETVERTEAEPEAAETTEETPDDAKADAETPSEEETEPQADSSPEPPADALNWETAPERFREEYKTLKRELTAAQQQNKLKEKFFEGPEAFLGELNELSSSQYQQTTQQIVKQGIEAMPNEFAEYLTHVAPDAVANSLAQVSPELLTRALGIDMDPAKVRKIIAQVKAQDLEEYLNDNDTGTPIDEPLSPKPQAAKLPPEAKVMTPEEIDRLVSQKVAEADKPKQIEALKQQAFVEVMAPVEALIDEMGLRPKPDDSPEDKAFKEMVVEDTLRATFDHLFENEKNAPKAQKMIEFIENLDKAGVKNLLSTAKVIAHDFAGQRLEIITAQRAKAKTKPTETKKTPPKVVPSSGGTAAFGNLSNAPVGRISDISDAEFERAIGA